jgi:hypothetical protein
MRKAYWCGMMLTVVAVAAVFVAADYIQRYPESPLGCCARTACNVALGLNPISALAPRVGQATYQVATTAQSPDQPAPCKDGACEMAVTVDETHTSSLMFGVGVNSDAGLAEEPQPVVIDLSTVTSAGMGGEEESSAPEPADAAQSPQPAQPEDEAAEVVTVPPTAIEDDAAVEQDPVPDFMPPATDEDDAAASDTPKMEELIQEELARQPASEAEEQAEPEELPMPNEGQPSDEPPQSGSNVEQRLNVTLNKLEFNDTPLYRVLDDLRLVSGIQMKIDKAAFDKEGIAGDWPISIVLEDVTIRSALEAILNNYNLAYLVKDDTILITTPNGVLATLAEPQGAADHCKASGGGCYVKDEPEDAADKTAENTAAAEGQDTAKTWDFWMQFFRFDNALAAGEDAPEELPMPAEEPAEDQPADVPAAVVDTPEPAGAGEESEAMPGTPPDCREDPHHDQQYPGCPYMGGCPGNMRTCPSPTPAEKKKEKDASAQPDVVEDTTIRRIKYEEFATPSAERPVHPDHFDWVPAMPKVDTMEFRPSDAQPGEFDPKPF